MDAHCKANMTRDRDAPPAAGVDLSPPATARFGLAPHAGLPAPVVPRSVMPQSAMPHPSMSHAPAPHAPVPNAAAPLMAHQVQPEPDPDLPWIVHVVDDDAAVCSSLKFALELDGFEVRTYPGYGELLASDLPRAGCLIVDYNLPGLNGLELLGELDRRDVHLPSFLITSNPTTNVRRRASAQGVAIIEKPLLGNQLSEAVRASFSRAMPC